MRRRFSPACLVAVVLLGLASWAGRAEAQAECGELSFTEIGGPWDYNDPADRARMLGVVEAGHFDRGVETLERGLSSIDVMGDINYTLRRFPNHHRALYSMAQYYVRNPEAKFSDTARSPDCYFYLAMKWRPGDGVVRMIYGIYLHKSGNYTEALRRYREALKVLPDSAELHYNLGLLHADTKHFAEARKHADRAYALGYPLPGLQSKLKAAGY